MALAVQMTPHRKPASTGIEELRTHRRWWAPVAAGSLAGGSLEEEVLRNLQRMLAEEPVADYAVCVNLMCFMRRRKHLIPARNNHPAAVEVRL